MFQTQVIQQGEGEQANSGSDQAMESSESTLKDQSPFIIKIFERKCFVYLVSEEHLSAKSKSWSNQHAEKKGNVIKRTLTDPCVKVNMSFKISDNLIFFTARQGQFRL